MNMTKRDCIIFIIYCFFAVIAGSFMCSCKTKKAPFVLEKPEIKKVAEKIVVVQVCDKFQMSYNGLACVVYFSNGSSASYTTAIDGKIAIRVPIVDSPENNLETVEIEKIIYNFAGYASHPGQLLASRDFKLATRIPSSPLATTTTVEGVFSSEVKNLFVLVR